jgi:formamidopyrimidine-DNA glycosylase
MPELPDIVVYIEHLERRVKGSRLLKVRIASPFLVRSFDPPISSVEGLVIRSLERIGKRIVFALEGDLYLILHLMVAGRLRWREVGAALPGKVGLAAMDFADGTLILAEAGSKRRASLHLVRGQEALRTHDPGGIEVLECHLADFLHALRLESHTLKRALTDPGLFSGIGNAYSDEILHAARLSPFKRTDQLDDAESARLFEAVRTTLSSWTQRLRSEAGDRFPEKVTAFREGMAVHGRHRLPCPVCSSPVQRIVYAENETNYCPRCQTGGRILADRSLSRLLRTDWPRSLEELEARYERARPGSFLAGGTAAPRLTRTSLPKPR